MALLSALLAGLFGVQAAPVVAGTAADAYNGLSTIDLQDPTAQGRLVKQSPFIPRFNIVM